MKKIIYSLATLLSALFLLTVLSSCGSADLCSVDYQKEAAYDISAEGVTETEEIENNIVLNDNAIQYSTKSAQGVNANNEGVVLKMCDGENMYIVTTEKELLSNTTSITVSVEDNHYNLQQYTINAPENYVMTDVRVGDFEYETFNIISCGSLYSGNPDLLQVNYHVLKFEDEETTPYLASQYFAIDDGTLKKLEIYDNSQTQKNKNCDFVKYSALYPTEPAVYMLPVELKSKDNVFYPEIYTYKVDFNSYYMVKVKQDFSTKNPLYFGYGYFALANSLYRYYSCDMFDIDDSLGFFEDPVVDKNSGSYKYSNFYFLVNDERFNSLEELINYSETIFSDDLAMKMIQDAPQKYKDFDGKLHTLNKFNAKEVSSGLMVITNVTKTQNGFKYTTEMQCNDKDELSEEYEYSGELVLEMRETESQQTQDSEDTEDKQYSLSPYGYVFTKYNNVVQKELS